jgi:hypothetical protein
MVGNVLILSFCFAIAVFLLSFLALLTREPRAEN